MLKHLFKTILPVAALAIGLATAACGNANITFGDDDGVPLAELDTSDKVPTAIALGGPDKVVVTEGAKLAITVSGDKDAIDALRFNLDDGTLGITRKKHANAPGVATIAVTLPALHEIILAGSGDIQAPAMAEKAEVNIGGSGTVAIGRLAASRFNVNIGGSGTLSTAGTAERLEFNVAGSGNLKARGLKVGSAEINIAGSGGGEFASDGTVRANVLGSGDVTVFGRADCKISAMGSGKLHCRNDDTAWNGDAKAPLPAKRPAAPKAPPAPKPPASTQ